MNKLFYLIIFTWSLFILSSCKKFVKDENTEIPIEKLLRDRNLHLLSLLNSSDFQEELLFREDNTLDLESFLAAMHYSEELKRTLISTHHLEEESSALYINAGIAAYREELIKSNKIDEWRLVEVSRELKLRSSSSLVRLRGANGSIDPADVHRYVIDYDNAHRTLEGWANRLADMRCSSTDFFRRGQSVIGVFNRGKKQVTYEEFFMHQENMANLSRDYLHQLKLCEERAGPRDPIGGGSGGSSNPKPTDAQLKNQIKDKPFALFGDLDCDIVTKWLSTAKHQVQQAQIDKLNAIRMSTSQVPWANSEVIAKVQDINNAYSTVVNMDYFPVTVSQLPIVNGQRLTATEFKEYLRKNINSFVDPDKGNFTPYHYLGINDASLWNSSDSRSTVIGIDIPGLLGMNDEITDDDGAVIVSGFSNTGWTFTTIYDPIYGQHPVSGNRDFGYTQNANGSYTFFTRGVDRLTYPAVTVLQGLNGIPFRDADALWVSFQNKITTFVNQHQGQAIVAPKEIQRPDWQLIKDVIDGKKPLSSLSTDCK